MGVPKNSKGDVKKNNYKILRITVLTKFEIVVKNAIAN